MRACKAWIKDFGKRCVGAVLKGSQVYSSTRPAPTCLCRPCCHQLEFWAVLQIGQCFCLERQVRFVSRALLQHARSVIQVRPWSSRRHWRTDLRVQ
jgi:hypothetical protein